MKRKLHILILAISVVFSFAFTTNVLFGGSGEKLEKPEKDVSTIQKDEKLTKPGRDQVKESEEVVSTEREKLQKPRKEEFQQSNPIEEKQVVTTGQGLELTKVSFYEIFPVFYKYYDENPLGNAVIHNWEESPATDVEVTVFIRHYMDIPKICRTPE